MHREEPPDGSGLEREDFRRASIAGLKDRPAVDDADASFLHGSLRYVVSLERCGVLDLGRILYMFDKDRRRFYESGPKHLCGCDGLSRVRGLH
jgi:hypothetical protein